MSAENPNPRTPEDDSTFKGENRLSALVVTLLGLITPKCPETTRLLSIGMDRSLPVVTRIRIRAHFLACCYCRHYRDQLYYMRELTRSHPWRLVEASPRALSLDAKERMKQALRKFAE